MIAGVGPLGTEQYWRELEAYGGNASGGQAAGQSKSTPAPKGKAAAFTPLKSLKELPKAVWTKTQNDNPGTQFLTQVRVGTQTKHLLMLDGGSSVNSREQAMMATSCRRRTWAEQASRPQRNSSARSG